jgi:hypothetical protein
MSPTTTDAGRSAGSQAMRAAGRQLIATAGNQVLKAAVDRAVTTVDQTAGRLDAFAAREPRPPRGRVAGTPAASGPERTPGSAVRAKVGASFSFVAHRAMLLLQLIQRLARQLLDALARLVSRARGGTASESEDETDAGPAPETADRLETAGRPRPASAAAAGQAQPPRRRRPAPDAPAAPARRRVPGGRPGRTATDG